MPRLKLNTKLSRIQRDPQLAAKAAGLHYTSDASTGWRRRQRGQHFQYFDAEGRPCTDKETLERIRGLVLPPAWTEVWICADPDGHLQATGIDAKGRKQYRYHPAWNAIRGQTKYFRLPQFAEALPAIRARLEHDLKKTGFPYEKVLALAVRIMEQTNIRVGNEEYKKLYGSFGLTTLQNRHVKVNGSEVRFLFKGKKGVVHSLELRSRRLSRLVQQCRELPGKELFQYLDAEGNCRSIGSGDVNAYLKEISGQDFTAKDFRTWSGTVTAFTALREIGPADSESAAKRNIVQAIDVVAESLGNTRTVCRKYYIHPAVPEAYEKDGLTDCPFPQNMSEEEQKWLSEEELRVKCLLADYTWA